MRRFTAIAVILGMLAATGGEPLHACATMDEPPPAAEAHAMKMPCHGDRATEAAPPEPAMDCCDGHDIGAEPCVDCLCTGAATPASALETLIASPVLLPSAYVSPLRVASPPERPPEFLLRPPISVS